MHSQSKKSIFLLFQFKIKRSSSNSSKGLYLIQKLIFFEFSIIELIILSWDFFDLGLYQKFFNFKVEISKGIDTLKRYKTFNTDSKMSVNSLFNYSWAQTNVFITKVHFPANTDISTSVHDMKLLFCIQVINFCPKCVKFFCVCKAPQ